MLIWLCCVKQQMFLAHCGLTTRTADCIGTAKYEMPALPGPKFHICLQRYLSLYLQLQGQELAAKIKWHYCTVVSVQYCID